MSIPNIRLKPQPHSECWRQEWPISWGSPGDVRRCAHGKVQVRTAVGPNSSIAGPGTDWWHTLSPFWDASAYKRAVKALA